MSYYGKEWLIDGLPTGLIMRNSPGNGCYVVVFEREYATLEQIEAINWAKPTIQYIGTHGNEQGLPEGYGFEVTAIEYYSGTKSYSVKIKTASQYLGDVTGYQDQIAVLENSAAEKDSVIAEQAAQLQDQEDVLTAQQAVIEDQAATIQELQEAGTAADLEAELDAAYVEGVNSVE